MLFFQIINSPSPFWVSEEIIIKYFNPLRPWIPLHRLHRINASLFLMNKTERAVTDAAARIELHRELVLWIKVVSEPCVSLYLVWKSTLDIVTCATSSDILTLVYCFIVLRKSKYFLHVDAIVWLEWEYPFNRVALLFVPRCNFH